MPFKETCWMEERIAMFREYDTGAFSVGELVRPAGSLTPLDPVSGDKGFPLHGPAEWFRHGGVEVFEETLDPLLEMVF